MSARQLSQAEYNSLKTAFRDLVKLVGTQQKCAERTRVDQTTISNYGSTDSRNDETFAPIDVIADLEAEVGPVVTRELAALANHMLVPLPPRGAGADAWADALGNTSMQVGDVLVAIGASIRDQKITPAERAKAKREIREAHQALAVLDAMLDAKGNAE